MHLFEFNVVDAVPSRQICWVLFLQAVILLLANSQAMAVQVEWHLSNVWRDESCTNICSDMDLRCTERCWPTTADGVKELTSNSAVLRNTCFDVTAGSPAAWHPAKDPVNTLCYWDAGAVSEPRCAVVPSTPVVLAVENKVIRRFCPCLNASDANNGVYVIDDCGLGSAPVAKAYVPVSASVPSPATSGTRAQQQTSARDSGDCSSLCVMGFEGLDADLNGEYSSIEVDGVFSHWSRKEVSKSSFSSVDISTVTGRWNFWAITAGGGRISLAESNSFARSGLTVPLDDTYASPQTDYEISFSCCGVGAAGSGSKNQSDDSLDTTTVLLVGGCTLFAVVAMLLTTYYLKYCNNGGKSPVHPPYERPSVPSDSKAYGAPVEPNLPLSASRFDPESARREWNDPTMRERPEAHTNAESAPLTYASSEQHQQHRYSPPACSIGMYETSRTSFHTTASQSVRSTQSDPFKPPPIQNRYTGAGIPVMGSSLDSFATYMPHMSSPPTHSSFGGSQHCMDRSQTHLRGGDDRAARQVAASMGTAYNGSARFSKGALAAVFFEEGLPVRIVGLVTEPTWDGAEGVVDSYDQSEGVVRIQFSDGRTKSVQQENCEPASQFTRRDSSRKVTPGSERKGHGGRMATPQGSGPAVMQTGVTVKPLADIGFPALRQ